MHEADFRNVHGEALKIAGAGAEPGEGNGAREDRERARVPGGARGTAARIGNPRIANGSMISAATTTKPQAATALLRSSAAATTIAAMPSKSLCAPATYCIASPGLSTATARIRRGTRSARRPARNATNDAAPSARNASTCRRRRKRIRYAARDGDPERTVGRRHIGVVKK